VPVPDDGLADLARTIRAGATTARSTTCRTSAARPAPTAPISCSWCGYFAYIFPLLLAIKTYQIFRQRHEPWQWSGWLFSWRLIGLVFLVLSGAALAHIHFHAARSAGRCWRRRWAKASAIWRATP
jgi:hypothetical protein